MLEGNQRPLKEDEALPLPSVVTLTFGGETVENTVVAGRAIMELVIGEEDVKVRNLTGLTVDQVDDREAQSIPSGDWAMGMKISVCRRGGGQAGTISVEGNLDEVIRVTRKVTVNFPNASAAELGVSRRHCTVHLIPEFVGDDTCVKVRVEDNLSTQGTAAFVKGEAAETTMDVDPVPAE